MMDEIQLKKILYGHINEICHFSQMQVFATSSYQKKYFQLQIDEAIDDLFNFVINYNNNKRKTGQHLRDNHPEIGQQQFDMKHQASNIRQTNYDNQWMQLDERMYYYEEPIQETEEQIQEVEEQVPVTQEQIQEIEEQIPVMEEQVQETGEQVPVTEELLQVPSEPMQEIEESIPEPGDGQPSDEVPLREVTLDELIENDGTGGKSAYVSVNGIVYDVTNVIRWAGGRHFGVYPGRDLTEDFMNCHNGVMDILKTLPKVGTLKL